jgi:hypothetical protein
MKRFTSLLVLLSLAACGTPKWKQPTDGPTAKARFEIRTDQFFAMAVTFPEKCTKRLIALIGASPHWVRESYQEGSSLNMLGGHPTPDGKRVERTIPANKPFLFQYQIMGSNAAIGGLGACALPMSFVPEANGQYEISADVIEKYCVMAVNRLDRDDRGAVRRTMDPTAKKEENLQCFWSY